MALPPSNRIINSEIYIRNEAFSPPKLLYRQILPPGRLIQLCAWRGGGLQHKLLLRQLRDVLSGILKVLYALRFGACIRACVLN